jgi:hypothetical protein
MKPQISILRAMSDPKLFAPWFRGKSWDAWRAFLAALFGLPMSPAMLEVFNRHTGRASRSSNPHREAWLCCGRRSGKSLIAALLAVFVALFRDYGQYLAPGELATVMVVAADRRQARVILRYVRGFVNEITMLKKMVVRELKESIEFSNRTVIEIHTASFRTIRGYSCAACINDELAFWVGDESSAEPAGEILAAQRPALATLPGALLISLSSPHARRGPLWEAYRTAFGKDDSCVLFWKGSSLEMNPALDPAIIKEAYDLDPVAAAAEYGAEFRSDCESFISRDSVETSVVRGRLELPKASGVRYHAFVDPSGGSMDSMTLAIAHLEKRVVRFPDGQEVRFPLALDLIREVKPPFSPEQVVREFAAAIKSYGISTVIGDHYAGEWPRERFSIHGVAYRPSEKSRSEIYMEMLPLLNSKRVSLLDNPRLVTQLSGLERHASRGGRETIDHAPGGHDDVANAAAGALVCAAMASTSEGAGGFLAVGGKSGPTIFHGNESDLPPGIDLED